MQPFTVLTAPAVVLPGDDIDTDVIFPARFLLLTAKAGLGRYAFHDQRGPDFPLGVDRPAAIVIAGENFGCGSSREQAVWALSDLGVRCIVAPSFGEIFRSNCFKSGVLPVVLDRPAIRDLTAAAMRGDSLTVDLTGCQVAAPGVAPAAFQVEDWRREALLNGWDDVLVLLNTQTDAIAAFETGQRARAPWLYSAG